MHADRFFKSANLLQQLSDDDETFYLKGIVLIPCMVHNAFSLELFLKCLATLHTGETPRGHSLVDLFKHVAPDVKARIREVYASNITDWDRTVSRTLGGPPADDFDAVLEISKDAFERFRYVYEPDDGHRRTFLAGQILMAIRTVIHEMHPDWMPNFPRV